MKTNQYTAIIVDDHKVVSAALKSIIDEIPTIGATYVASTGSEALDMAANIHFDLCIIDLELPDMSGFEIIDRLRIKHKDIRVIVSTMHDEVWIVSEVIRAKVDGMLTKSADIMEYQEAIEKVLQGGKYYCESYLAVWRMNSNEAKDLLSESELKVLKLMIKGLTTAQIAARLFRSVNTIETHRRHIMDKFHANNIVEIVNKANRLGYSFDK